MIEAISLPTIDRMGFSIPTAPPFTIIEGHLRAVHVLRSVAVQTERCELELIFAVASSSHKTNLNRIVRRTDLFHPSFR